MQFTNKAIKDICESYLRGEISANKLFRIFDRSNIRIENKQMLILNRLIGVKEIFIKGI